jgi:AcrR family transcriptional regulator
MVSTAPDKNAPHGYDSILQAALQLFSMRGYEATSIDDIRQAAGFKSKASLYTHFKSKEEIASALQQTIIEDENQVIMRTYHAADPEPLARFFAIGKAFIAWSMNHPQEASFCFLRVQQEALIRGKLAYMRERQLPSDLILLQLIGELRQNYPVRHIADTALLTMISGVIIRAVIDQAAFGGASRETITQQILEVCFSILFSEPVPIPA